MIMKVKINKEDFFFILLKENKIIALIQKGNNDLDIILEIRYKNYQSEVIREIERNLLCEHDSAYMTSAGNWEYMKEYVYKSANLYRPFLWAYYDPDSKEIKCGFEINIDKIYIWELK